MVYIFIVFTVGCAPNLCVVAAVHFPLASPYPTTGFTQLSGSIEIIPPLKPDIGMVIKGSTHGGGITLGLVREKRSFFMADPFHRKICVRFIFIPNIRPKQADISQKRNKKLPERPGRGLSSQVGFTS